MLSTVYSASNLKHFKKIKCIAIERIIVNKKLNIKFLLYEKYFRSILLKLISEFYKP